MMSEDFSRFEHEGWERVAGKYDSVWSKSTRQFIPYLLDAADVRAEMSFLDVGCGPGYVAAAAAGREARPVGLDFSAEMVRIAKTMFPEIQFRVGDAQNLPYTDSSFDRVLSNFALLHVSDPERAAAEAFRVLKKAEAPARRAATGLPRKVLEGVIFICSSKRRFGTVIILTENLTKMRVAAQLS